MKKSIQIILIVLLAGVLNTKVQSQNLVPNGDFELGPNETSVSWYIACNFVDSVAGADDWTSSSCTPDRLVYGTICSSLDNDSAKSGMAYINIGVCGVNFPEAIKASLTSPLQKDSIYKLSYYLNFQEGCPSSNAAIKFDFNNGNTIISPIINENNWNYFDATFIALNDANTIEIIGNGQIGSCVEIDNVILQKVNSSFISKYANINSTVRIWPNPSNGIFSVYSLKYSEIEIYNSLGEDLFYNLIIIQPKSTIEINLTEYPKGLYLMIIKNKSGINIKKIIIN